MIEPELTEEDYIIVRDLTRLRIAREALVDIQASFITQEDIKTMRSLLRTWEIRFEKELEKRMRGTTE